MRFEWVVPALLCSLTSAVLLSTEASLPAPIPATETSDYYSRSSSMSYRNTNWMSRIADTTSLAGITIPGTHDSGATRGGDLVECQSLSIRNQLNAGIRFLDIRCRQTQDSFAIHHGVVYQGIMFGDVQNQCTAFLQANPTECIVMRVKNERPNDRLNPVGTWADVFNAYKNRASSYWYTGSSVPNMGAARGKIVLMTSESGIGGINWNGLDIQDDYNVPTLFHRSGKWTKVKNQLNAARNGSRSTYYMNFASGSSGGAYPNAIARYVNDRLYDHVGDINTRWGTVVMDFPGGNLIRRLVESNF